MAKYTEQQVKLHKKHITIADMENIAGKYGRHSHTLKRALWGEMHYDTGDKKRQAMIKEATDLIRLRVANDMKVINPEKL